MNGPHLPFDPHSLPQHDWAPALAAYAIALAVSVVLAAWLTPRHWWRRPTLRGGAVLAGGTLGFGTLFLMLAGPPRPALAAAALPLATPLATPTAASAPELAAPAPSPGARYRVVDTLNLRADRGVHAARLAVLPAGSRVLASGAVDGDWWQVRARVGGRTVTGWTSSLWLRRADEE
jgi:hypothetical protein